MPNKNPVKRAECLKKYRQENADKIRKYLKKYRQENTGKARDYKKKYLQEHHEKNLECLKKYRQENADKIRKYLKKYRQKNADKIRKYHKKYYQENAEESLEYQKKYCRERVRTDVNYRLKRRLQSQLSRYIRAAGASKSQRSEQLLGCTWNEVRIHLERQWLPGMSWDNNSNGPGNWNIDHIRPLSSFDLTDPGQQQQAFHYTNLQPLWWEDNMAKSDKWPGGSQ